MYNFNYFCCGKVYLLMNNVYDGVRLFFKNNTFKKDFLNQHLIDDFLRKKAWEGKIEQELAAYWFIIEMFMKYIKENDIKSLNELVKDDYLKLFLWIPVASPKLDYEITFTTVNKLLKNLIDFHKFLKSKKSIFSLDEIYSAQDVLFRDKGLKSIKDEILSEENTDSSYDELGFPDELAYKVNVLIESLINNIGSYYQSNKFNRDFNRAINIYTGPINDLGDEEDEEFWLGFWDYFLFDYHLIRTNETPLMHFAAKNYYDIDKLQQKIMRDLLKAKFTVFYITKILNDNLVECIDLFTDETFKMPMPEFGINEYKNLLFYGHINYSGFVMLNYISSIKVSPILRKRIKEEVLKVANLYFKQEPTATLSHFFVKHSVVVRHIVYILLTLAKVNVVSLVDNNTMETIDKKIQPNLNVTKLLEKTATKLAVSQNDLELMRKIWYDFSQLYNSNINEPNFLAVAVIYIFFKINDIIDIEFENIFNQYKYAQIYDNIDVIMKELNLQKFDLRYLSEEGYVLSLYLL